MMNAYPQRHGLLVIVAACLWVAMESAMGQQVDTSQWTETAEGVEFGPDDPFRKVSAHVAGATLLKRYQAYRPQADQREDREKNRAVVRRFFELPMGAEAAHLYAADGNKQLPNMGIQWRGIPALIKNNEQNSKLFAGWKWTDIIVWDTQDPTAFWVECQGGQVQEGGAGTVASHYILQFVVRQGKIEIMKEFTTPFARGLE
ncbi:MAG: PhzA/PhzB family protein [Gammaproteobacteria bacterium]|nr:PhzA/PhzB family protein [Gammaproteobacteria bacterium]